MSKTSVQSEKGVKGSRGKESGVFYLQWQCVVVPATSQKPNRCHVCFPFLQNAVKLFSLCETTVLSHSAVPVVVNCSKLCNYSA